MRSLKQVLKAFFTLSAAVSVHLGCAGGGGSTPAPPVAPTITSQPANQTVLEGATATVAVTATGTAPFSYQWKKGATAVTGATSASYTTPASVLADSGSSFTVTVTNVAGNVTSSAATLTVNPAPPTITTQPSNLTVTAGSTATFTVLASGTAPFSYQWNLGGSPISGANSASYATPVTTLADHGGSFTVTVTNAAGHVTSSAATLTVNPAPPTLTTQPSDRTVTAGSTATFTVVASGTAPLSYQWNLGGSPIGGATSASYTTPVTTLADNGASFTVTVIHPQGTVTSSAAVLTVQAAPVFLTQPAGTTTVTAGAAVTFTAAATGNPAPTYQWYRGTALLSNQTAATLTLAGPTLLDAGSYTVIATNILGSATSSAAVLVVNQLPIFTTQPASLTVTTPASATFAAAASGFPVPAFQWKKGGVSITGATNATYTLAGPTLLDAGSYTVVATNSLGSVISNPAVLVVNQLPVFTTQPAGLTVTAAASAAFTAVASGFPVPTFQWRKGSANINGAINASYTLAGTTLADAGSYTVIATNSLGSVTSSAAVLVVNQLPIFTTQPASLTVTTPASATFTAAASGFPAPTFQWQKAGANITGAMGATYLIATTSLADAATYACVATNSSGAATSSGAVLTIQVLPAITTQPVGATLTAGGSASFTVIATGTPAPTYQWQKTNLNISGATSSSFTIAGATLGDAGVYTVVVKNAAGSVTSGDAVLTVNGPPVITNQPASQSLVVGQAATFSVAAAGNPPPSYQWRKSLANIAGATGSTYTTPATLIGDSGSSFDVVVSNSLGTVTSNTALLTVNPAPAAPTITTQPVNQTVGAGASVTFSAAATGTPTPAFQWYKNGAVIIGATNSSYIIASVVPADAATYAMSATNGHGSITSSGATLTVLYAPVITVQPISQTVSQGTGVTFTVAGNGNPPPSYQWLLNGGNIFGATSSAFTITGVLPGNAGSYAVLLTNSQGSVTSSVATLAVTPNYSVFGQVILAMNGSPVPGVTLSIDTTPATTALTDGTGHFTLPNIPNGTYTVTPSLTGPSALFFPAIQPVTVAGANANNVQFQASLGYTVSGTVSYTGPKTSRVYLRLDGNNGSAPGVSISAKSAFTIRGVAPGTYTLNSWMEDIGLGNANASNPTGSVSVNVAFADYTGANVNLVDPAAINLTGTPGPILNVARMSGGAFLQWQPRQSLQFVETADHYLIEWSTSIAFATIAGQATVPAMGQNNPMYFAAGLTDGTPYYFRISALAGATTSIAVVSPAVIPGPGTGANTISGTVSFTGPATGPLYVGFYDRNTGIPYAVRIASPVSPQTFTSPGVPNGSFVFFGILDQNGDGFIDIGDISNVNGNNSPALVVTGSMAGQSLTLPSLNALTSVSTSHQRYTGTGGTSESYGLQFNVNQNIKLPVNVAIQVGTAVFDVGKPNGNGYNHWVNLGTLRPGVADPYPIVLGYSDGAIENPTAIAGAVLDTFPINLSPNTAPTGVTTPTFSWSAPFPAPLFPYTFGQLWVQQKNGGNIWSWPSKNEIPNTTLSVLYNKDGKATAPSLTLGVTYAWTISVRDAARNEAQQTVEFTP